MNEDVFMAPASPVREVKSMESDIQEITEQIHRLLLQVRKSGQRLQKRLGWLRNNKL